MLKVFLRCAISRPGTHSATVGAKSYIPPMDYAPAAGSPIMSTSVLISFTLAAPTGWNVLGQGSLQTVPARAPVALGLLHHVNDVGRLHVLQVYSEVTVLKRASKPEPSRRRGETEGAGASPGAGLVGLVYDRPFCSVAPRVVAGVLAVVAGYEMAGTTCAPALLTEARPAGRCQLNQQLIGGAGVSNSISVSSNLGEARNSPMV